MSERNRQPAVYRLVDPFLGKATPLGITPAIKAMVMNLADCVMPLSAAHDYLNHAAAEDRRNGFLTHDVATFTGTAWTLFVQYPGLEPIPVLKCEEQ